MTKLPLSFYQRDDVVKISRELIGKFLFTKINGSKTGGMIVEVEAYTGRDDKASHAHNGKETNRNRVMYGPAGTAYVYLCYGIHKLFNIVTNVEGKADAVLVRAIQPTEGVEVMLRRRNLEDLDWRIAGGPGSMSRALGIERAHYGTKLTGDVIWLEDHGCHFQENQIKKGTRVGVEYAEEDALKSWRFQLADNIWVSRAK